MLALLFFSQKNSIEEGNFDDPGGRLHKKQPIICVFFLFFLFFFAISKFRQKTYSNFQKVLGDLIGEFGRMDQSFVRAYSWLFVLFHWTFLFVFFVFILLLFEKKTDRMMMTIDDYHSSNPLLYHVIIFFQIVCQNIRIFNFTNATKEIQRWKVENSFTDSAVRIKTVSI